MSPPVARIAVAPANSSATTTATTTAGKKISPGHQGWDYLINLMQQTIWTWLTAGSIFIRSMIQNAWVALPGAQQILDKAGR